MRNIAHFSSLAQNFNYMKITRTHLPVLFFLLSLLSSAQENYIEGYIVQDSDTLKGLINYRNWQKNPKKIGFRTSSDSPATFYGPLDIESFEVSGEIYVGSIVDIETSRTEDRWLDENSEFNIKKDTAFLQAVVIGAKSLYYYLNANGRENFYIQRDNDLQLLKYKRYRAKIEELNNNNASTRTGSTIAENKKYLGNLSLYLGDCSDIRNQLSNTQYTKKDLKKLFDHYYDCVSEKPTYEKTRDKVILETGLLLGLSFNQFQADPYSVPLGGLGLNYDYLSQTDFGASIFPAVGVSFNAIIPRTRDKFSIYNELLFSGFQFKERNVDSDDSGDFVITTDSEIRKLYLKINNLARYIIKRNNSYELFLHAGISNQLEISTANKQNSTVELFDNVEENDSGPAIPQPKNAIAYQFGLGIIKDKYSAEIRYELGGALSGVQALNAQVNKVFVLLGYNL